MKPPKTINVLNGNDGFVAITKSPTYVKIVMGSHGEREATPDDYTPTLNKPFVRWQKVMKERDTVWRPANLLKKTTQGTLDEFNEQSFYQTNDNVTQAFYRVAGYKYRVVVWFDNKTGERIA